jgi:hypothetical protein
MGGDEKPGDRQPAHQMLLNEAPEDRRIAVRVPSRQPF